MNGNCFICHYEFVKNGKNYDRYRIGALCSQDTFLKVFPLHESLHASINTNAFLCIACVDILNKNTVAQKCRKGGKRSILRLWPGTPPSTPPTKEQSRKRPYPATPPPAPLSTETTTGSTPRTGGKECASTSTKSTTLECRKDDPLPPVTRQQLIANGGFTQKAANFITNYEYQRAFGLLAACSPPAKRALISVVQGLIKNERKSLQMTQTSFEHQVTPDNIQKFNWEKGLNEMEQVAPITLSTLKSMFPEAKTITGHRMMGPKKDRRKQTLLEAEETLNIRIGTAMSVVLFTRNPQRFKFFQCAMGVEMWRQGSTQKTVATLNRMGISQGTSAARKHVDRLCANHDSDMLLWKSTVEERQQNRPKRFDLNRKPAMASNTLLPTNSSYGVCWDNVQILAKAAHEGLEKGNTFMLWGLTFGVSHRVPTLHLQKDDIMEARAIDPSAFVPSRDDYLQLQSHMEHMVVVILGRNLDCLQHLRFPKHLHHAHTEAMNKRSDVVNLGVIDANPSSTDGTIEIMEHLYKYVPTVEGKPVQILCSGDGQTVERMVHAHLGRANGWDHDKRLSGLVEAPQEFHKEVILLQDFMNQLYSGGSIGDRGTLAQLKQEFNHRSLKKEVKENVQQVWDMLEFATEAYVTKCALQLRQVSTVDDLPPSFPVNGTPADQKEWVRCLAAEVVNFCWAAPTECDLAKVTLALKQSRDNIPVATANAFAYCCLEAKAQDMVQCCSWQCERMWFHYGCAGLDGPPPEDEDWYCSEACRQDGTYIYCYCHQRKGGQMLQCKLGGNCKCHEWYHTECIDAAQPTTGDWYCSDSCELDVLQDDPVLNHSKTLMWLGLNNLVRRDAVREGNGPEIIQHWRMDMINFWHERHPKYFIIAHQLLANIGGFMPEHIREDLIWNRLGNLLGIPGRNIGLDQINEFLNCDFKELLLNCNGRYTADEIARCAQMGGAFGRYMDRLFTLSGLGQYDTRPSYASHDHYKEDIRAFCEDYEDDALFSYLPGVREMEGFPGFTHDSSVKFPERMGQKVHALSQKMDGRRDLARRQRVPPAHDPIPAVDAAVQ